MEYSSRTSLSRAEQLQKLCEAQGLSATVFILGLDSNRSQQDQQLFFWLFKGLSGPSQLSSSLLPLAYEEIAWIMTPHSVEIFIGSSCNSLQQTEEVCKEVLNVSASWTGVNVTALIEEEIIDSDLAEETKVLWFNRRMKTLKGKIGFAGTGVERWPLVQAYAIDMFGLGFFSESHTPVDISGYLEPLYSLYDEATAVPLISQHLPRLERDFEKTVEFIDKKRNPETREEITQNEVNDCLLFPFEYATLQSDIERPHCPSVSLYGATVVKEATHMGLVGVCGNSSLLCARTWFFIARGFAKELVKGRNEEFSGLDEAYNAVAASGRKSIIEAVGLSEDDIKQGFLYELFKDRVFAKHHELRDRCRIELLSYDADGRSFPFDLEQYLFHSFYVEITGGVVFGESFCLVNGKVIILTSNIDSVKYWEKETRKDTAGGENKLSSINNCEIAIPNIGIYPVSLEIYDESIKLNSISIGIIHYNTSEIERLTQVSSNSIEICAENASFLVKMPEGSLLFLASLWEIEQSETPMSFPTKIPVSLPPPSQEPPSCDNKTPLHIVIGVGSSGKSKTAHELATTMKTQAITASLPNSASLDKDSLSQSLLNASGPSVILSLPDFFFPLDILDIIPESLYIRSVIAKVNSSFVYENNRKTFLPGFIHSIKVANIVIYEETEENTEIFKLLSQVNPNVEIYRTNGVLSPQQSKNILCSSPTINVQIPFNPLAPLSSAFIFCDFSLVESKLRQKLANSEKLDEGALNSRLALEYEQQIIMIKGCVNLKGKEALTQLGDALFDITGTPQRLSVKKGFTETPGLLFIGRNLNQGKLIDFVLECRSQGAKLPLKTRESISREEIDAIERAIEPSDEYLFDGTYYIDPEGRKSMQHPELENSLGNYIEEENEAIGDFNRQLEKEATVTRNKNCSVCVQGIYLGLA